MPRGDSGRPCRGAGVRARLGISLFEAVAAIAIVGATAVSALSAVSAELRTATRARRALEVEALATSRLDFLGLMSDQQLQNLPDSVAKGTFDPPLANYRWVTTATPLATQAGIYDIRIQVLWKDGVKDASYGIESYVYRRPPLATSGNGR